VIGVDEHPRVAAWHLHGVVERARIRKTDRHRSEARRILVERGFDLLFGPAVERVLQKLSRRGSFRRFRAVVDLAVVLRGGNLFLFGHGKRRRERRAVRSAVRAWGLRDERPRVVLTREGDAGGTNLRTATSGYERDPKRENGRTSATLGRQVPGVMAKRRKSHYSLEILASPFRHGGS
jgi:hypothetical protein